MAHEFCTVEFLQRMAILGSSYILRTRGLVSGFEESTITSTGRCPSISRSVYAFLIQNAINYNMYITLKVA